MADFDKKCCIEQNSQIGRYVVAACDLRAGETILIEQPILIMPFADERRCSNCFKLTQHFCSKCKIFNLCENCTQHNTIDCDYLAKLSSQIQLEPLQKHANIYGPLKCLLLNQQVETSSYFNQLYKGKAHLNERKNAEIWQESMQKIVAPMLTSGIMQHMKVSIAGDEECKNTADYEEQILQKLCGLIDVNIFEIRAPDEGGMKGLYLKAALFSHDCMANTVVSIDENHQMKIYANRDVNKGETLTICYTNPLLGTDERRRMLLIGKYFHCNCQRCSDPAELGSHMSSIICASCAGSGREDGYVVKHSSNQWKCNQCEHSLKADYVESILERAKEQIFHAKGDIYHYELLLAKLSRILHSNHYLMIDLKQNIAAILRSIIQNLGQKPGRKVYERKVRLCQEILVVLQIVQPGISRLKAIALYELCNSFAELSRLRFGEKDIAAEDLLRLLKQAEAMLRESIRMLLYEPADTPEGQLAKSMLKDLKDLQNDMKLLQE